MTDTPETLEARDNREAGEARARRIRGQIIAGLGAAILIMVIAWTGYAASTHGQPDCEADARKDPPAAGKMAWSTNTQLNANGHVCIGVKPATYFVDERTQHAELTLERDAALADRKTLQADLDALNRAPRTGAATEAAALNAAKAKVDEAEKKRAAIQAKLDAVKSEATLIVFVDGKPMPIKTTVHVHDAREWVWTDVLLRVPADATTDEARAWREMLSDSGLKGHRKVSVSLGDEGAKLPKQGADIRDMTLRSFQPGWLGLGALGLVLLGVGLVIWGWGSGMLRDRPPTAAEPNPPFSLGRTQMAFWFLLSLGGFLVVWLITGQNSGVMTSGMVALLGISGVTGAAAIAVDRLPPPQGALQPAVQHSSGFLTDILSADGGIVFHRVQMLAWTLVLGAIFLWKVLWDFTFPTFDQNLLLLSGVVSGVYLGFKFPEK